MYCHKREERWGVKALPLFSRSFNFYLLIEASPCKVT